jgi:hypothetical protein
MAQRVPQELIDEIIDHCSGDRRTLISCSLTSRAWVHRTRKCLFSTLAFTDKTLQSWCDIVATPLAATGSKSQPAPGISPSYTYHRLPSYVTSLQLVSKCSCNHLVKNLVQGKYHLSAFSHLEALTFTCISFLNLEDASLEACFGSLAKTVQRLKLSMCSLDEERFLAFVGLFTRLESLEVRGNEWTRSSSAEKAKDFEKERLTLRGSFAASETTNEDDGLLESLATVELKYHTITIGWSNPFTFAKFNILFTKCGDHLETLSLTAPTHSRGYPGKPSLYVCPPPQLDWTNEISNKQPSSGSLPL